MAVSAGDVRTLGSGGLGARAALAPRRIALVIDRLHMGGAERLLVEYASRLRRGGDAVTVILLENTADPGLAAGLKAAAVPVEHVPVRRALDAWGALRLAVRLRTLRADLVHVQLERSNLVGTVAARLVGIPVVSTLHTIDVPDDSRAGRRIRLMERALSRFASRVICVSDAQRRALVSRDALPADRLHVLPNGIDLAAWPAATPASRAAAREALGLPPDVPVAMTVAVLRRPKGIATMVAAMPRILHALPDAHYVVLGTGEERGNLTGLATGFGIADRVHLVGQRLDVAALMPAADLFVLPTLTDALPTVLAEAMAVGLPLVASAVGGVPEMLENGVNGLLVPPGDPAALATACIRILADRGLSAGMAEAGQRIVAERFDLDRQARLLAEHYARAARGVSG